MIKYILIVVAIYTIGCWKEIVKFIKKKTEYWNIGEIFLGLFFLAMIGFFIFGIYKTATSGSYGENGCDKFGETHKIETVYDGYTCWVVTLDGKIDSGAYRNSLIDKGHSILKYYESN